jgi:hypothetical protein
MSDTMNQRDQELLNKQFRWLSPSPRNDGVVILAIVMVFFTGIALGGTVFAHLSDPMQLGSNDATAAISPSSAVSLAFQSKHSE